LSGGETDGQEEEHDAQACAELAADRHYCRLREG
jgi:hypothetical protein